MINYEQLIKDAGEAAAKEAAKVASRVAIETWEKERKKEARQRVDRRLRNTKLLLDNYRSFAAHIRCAVFEASLLDDESAIHILDMMDAYDVEYVAIESIKRSTVRTAVIVAHIEEMLGVYRAMCERSSKSEDIRRYRIIKTLYIEECQMSILDIAEQEKVDQRTVYRDRDVAFERLAALFFGIDGMQKRR